MAAPDFQQSKESSVYRHCAMIEGELRFCAWAIVKVKVVEDPTLFLLGHCTAIVLLFWTMD